MVMGAKMLSEANAARQREQDRIIFKQIKRIKELEEGIQAIVDEFAEMTSDIRIELKKLLKEDDTC